MIILGIDPGSRTSGFGLIEYQSRKFRYIHSGVMKFSETKSFIDRLATIYQECCGLIEQYQPEEIAIESLIYVKSVTALAKLAQARGAMLSAFTKTHRAKIFEYSPNLVKSSVSGHGHASKEGIDKMVGLLIGKKDFKTHDESDALAIAICHALQSDYAKNRFLKSGEL